MAGLLSSPDIPGDSRAARGDFPSTSTRCEKVKVTEEGRSCARSPERSEVWGDRKGPQGGGEAEAESKGALRLKIEMFIRSHFRCGFPVLTMGTGRRCR